MRESVQGRQHLLCQPLHVLYQAVRRERPSASPSQSRDQVLQPCIAILTESVNNFLRAPPRPWESSRGSGRCT